MDFCGNVAVQTWAAIFDWDGVILDSSRQHEEAWNQLAAEEGRTLAPNFFRQSFGMKNDRVITHLLGWTQAPDEVRALNERKEAHFRTRLAQTGATPLPGVVAWLQALRAAGVPCAIASSTPRQNIDCAMAFLRLQQYFVATIAAEDVTQGKPHPEVFLLAARRLGAPPQCCVVFEDAHVGIEAGLKAGMRVVAVATTHPADSLQQAHRVVGRLDELDIADIAAWMTVRSARLTAQ
jgi:beta-phosphoglucomutase family hydrolase